MIAMDTLQTGAVMVVFAFVVLSVLTLPILFHFRVERRKREFEHLERMRSLELGRPFGGDKKFGLPAIPQWAVPHLVAASIGAVVPLGVFGCAS